MPLLEARDVWKIYGSGESATYALRGVNITIDEGEFVAIMGPSGSGKSTLMHILGALDVPTKGKVHIMGRDVSGMNEKERAEVRRKIIGFVFQQFYLSPNLRVWENVALPLLFAGVPAEKRRKRAMELLKEVGLEEKAEKFPNQLSGGQQQRVAIARALANDPKVILADEPTGNLDSKTGKRIMELFTDLNKRGKTLVVVTHDPSIAAYAEKVYHVRDGKIVGVKA